MTDDVYARYVVLVTGQGLTDDGYNTLHDALEDVMEDVLEAAREKALELLSRKLPDGLYDAISVRWKHEAA